MTAAPNPTKVPLSPLALIMFTLTAATTASVAIGFLLANTRRRDEAVAPLDNLLDGSFAREVDYLEQRLRSTSR